MKISQRSDSDKELLRGLKNPWCGLRKTVSKHLKVYNCLRSETYWQMSFCLDFRSYSFEAAGPNCFIVLCKILLPWKVIAKSISRSPKRPVQTTPTKFFVWWRHCVAEKCFSTLHRELKSLFVTVRSIVLTTVRIFSFVDFSVRVHNYVCWHVMNICRNIDVLSFFLLSRLYWQPLVCYRT